jgi:N-acetylneuraminic acid mutarotase
MSPKLASLSGALQMSFRASLGRRILSRPARPRPLRRWSGTGFVLAVLVLLAAGGAAPRWSAREQLPLPRTEVAAAVVNGRIAVAGGFLLDGSSSRAVDLYLPRDDRWTRLPDLPLGVNHAAAAVYRGRLLVVGGYAGPGQAYRGGWELRNGRWRALPQPPEARAAGGAAVVGSKLYVVGGVGAGGLARRMLVFDLVRRRWTTAPGPTPREHLAVRALGGRVYALAGRTAGIDTNLAILETWALGWRRWRRLPPVPSTRGGTGVAAVGRELISVGGEEPAGTIADVWAYHVDRRRWRRLPDLPTPRHGLGVVALGGSVYAIAGGERPGLFVSGANEALALR